MEHQSHIVTGKKFRFPGGKIISYTVFILWVAITVLPLIWMAYSSFKSNEELNLDTFALPYALFDNANDEFIVIGSIEGYDTAKRQPIYNPPSLINVVPDYNVEADPRPRLIIESATIGWSRRLMVYFLPKEELSPEIANLKPLDSVWVNQLPGHIQGQINWLTIWYNYNQAYIRANLGLKFLNSVLYSVVSSVLIVLFGLMMGFALSKLKFKRLAGAIAATVGFGYLLSTNSIIIPLYLMLSFIGLTDSHFGVIIVYVAFGMPVSTMLSTQFIRGLPDSLIESAYIDGASTMRTFVQIIFPMSMPVATTILILNILGIWNEFLLVLVVAGSEATKSLPVGVYSFSGLTSTQLGWQLAAMVMAILPPMIFYFIFNKRIAQGVVGGAIKG